MTTCRKCGADLPEGALFCHKCGASTAPQEEFVVDSDRLIETVKELIHEGNVRRIIVKDENGKLLMEIPVTIGVIGALIAPWLAALGAIAALATRCTIIVERRE
ncbi:MAG: DUF4342 domain-containing protein [Theionarchaea archaeon]|nr:DUF4342 domain-containing protein [Theionarchaea archaeon]